MASQSQRAHRLLTALAVKRWCSAMPTRGMSSYAVGHKTIPVTQHQVEGTKHVIGHTAIPTTTIPKKDVDDAGGSEKVPLEEVKGMNAKTKALLQAAGFTSLFPVQASAFEPVLKGQDTIARSKTGTGKTLAFLLPLIQRITESGQQAAGGHCTVLIIEPTRELARQVREELMKLTRRVSSCVVHGGASFSMQEDQIRPGVDFLIATPGRLADLMEKRTINLSEVSTVVLDEADEMLKIGFEKELTQIMDTIPEDAQTLLFSATMPAWVKDVAKHRLKKPFNIDSVSGTEKTPDTISHVALCTSEKVVGINFLIKKYARDERTIVFCKTKLDCGHLASRLPGAIAIHGDVTQGSRDQAIRDFKSGVRKVLVATDVAARGLDIPNVQLVVHQGTPDNVEHYIHRSGRTGRAGKTGVSAMVITPEERKDIRGLGHQIGRPVEAVFMNHNSSFENTITEAMNLTKATDIVHKSMVEVAEKFIQAKGPQGVAVLLSKMHIGDPPRSLLTGAKNYTTVHLDDVSSYDDIVSKLGAFARSIVYTDFYKATNGITCAAVDVPSQDIPAIQKLNNSAVTIPDSLSPRVLTHGLERGSVTEGHRSTRPSSPSSSRFAAMHDSNPGFNSLRNRIRSGSSDRFGSDDGWGGSSSSTRSRSSNRSNSYNDSRGGGGGGGDRFSNIRRSQQNNRDDEDW